MKSASPLARNLSCLNRACFSSGLVLGLVWLSAALTSVGATDRAAQARQMDTELRAKVLPYWFDTAQDKTNGGYLLADDAVKGRGNPTEKQLVSQTRMVWGFSHVHRKGYSDAQRDYLQAAAQGYRFLLAHFRDLENGGYYWKTDLAGKAVNDRKVLYGEAFVIYAFVEYFRASGDREALRHAMELYRLIQVKGRDSEHGGWFEHFTRDWKPLMAPYAGNEVEVPGYKSANAHLHWMEALAELYDATKDADVKRSLAEAVKINATYFYPKKAGQSCFHRQPDWKPVTDPKSAGLSYGHNVEFAWLMIRAEEVLGSKPSWDHFDAHLRHALEFGYDHERGGLYDRGEDDHPATRTDKVWWVQSEMLAALTDALKHQRDAAYSDALDKLIRFVWTHQVNPADGIWLDTVTAEGRPKSTGKAHQWKANYHDVRAVVKFIEAFRGAAGG
jgi:mannobiose 2-epimerase